MIKMDTREWSRTLAQYMEHTKKDLATVINTKALYIDRGAIRETEKADIQKLTEELRDGLAEKIIRARYFKEGKKQPSNAEVEEKAKRLIAARRRSVGFLKAGWIPGIQAFNRALGRSSTAPSRSLLWSKSNIGGAKAAQPGWKIEAEMWNAAVATHGGQQGEAALAKFATAGWEKAAAKEVASMKVYIEGKLQGTANRYNGHR